MKEKNPGGVVRETFNRLTHHPISFYFRRSTGERFLFGSSAIVIPDLIKTLSERIVITENGTEFNGSEPLLPAREYSRTERVTRGFLQDAEYAIEATRHAYTEVLAETIHNPLLTVNPAAPNALQTINNLLPRLGKNRKPASATDSEHFLGLAGEDAFYVMKLLFLTIPLLNKNLRIEELIQQFEASPVPLKLSSGVSGDKIIPLLYGMQNGHSEKGFNPDLLESRNNLIDLRYTTEELVKMFVPGENKGGTCPASMSRRHVLGSHYDKLKSQFPYPNAIKASQQQVTRVINGLVG